MQHELNDTGGARDLAILRMDSAREDLKAADINLKMDLYKTANNRSYYAIFHALSACLALEFKSFKSHASAIGCFNKDFIHTGYIPVEVSKRIARVQEIRHASDYDDFFVVSKSSTEQQVEDAHYVVDAIEKYIMSAIK